MNSNWSEETQRINSIHDFSDWLAKSSKHTKRIYRGQAKSCWSLQTTLDRYLQKIKIHGFEEKRQIERELIAEFRCKAGKYLGAREKVLIDNRKDDTEIMTVMQHFGVPTRLLDWTRFRAMAAYCACIDHEDRDGTIWWVEKDAIVDFVDDKWEGWEYTRCPHPVRSQISLGQHLDKPDVEKFVCTSFIRDPFQRAHIQQGLFTFGSRFGLDHDVQLKAQLPCGTYGRLDIPTTLKREIIRQLSAYGIDGTSLQYSGADQVGLKMTWDRELEAGKNENKDGEDATR